MDTKSIAVGIRDQYVVVWYCSKGNTGAAAAYKKNVGKLCLQDGYDQCFSEKALIAHNKYRKIHGSPDLIADKDVSKKIQALITASIAAKAGQTGDIAIAAIELT